MKQKRHGVNGDLISVKDNGGPSAKITAIQAMRGITLPTTSPGRAPIDGEKMASPASRMISSEFVLSLALWNEKDPILKERLFGLTNSEGNHGEDVKEYYFYLDSTPSHSYMKYLYKYPQSAYPYDDLVATNRQRNRDEMEYELLDTKIFDHDRYFDVFVEYAKESPDDLFIKITVSNRGTEPATIHVLPTLWFRNTWSSDEHAKRPQLKRTGAPGGIAAIVATEPTLGEYFLYAEGDPELLFTENETNNQRLFGTPNATPYVKDAFHSYLVNADKSAINPKEVGTKAAAHYNLKVGPGESKTIRLRLTQLSPADLPKSFTGTQGRFGPQFDEVFNARQREADEFYKSITPSTLSEDQARVMRQALAGMLWTKQHYFFDADRWLQEHHVDPMSSKSRNIRNRDWFHMENDDVISMPDKWEYPWFAAWDLAFHTTTFGRRPGFCQAAAGNVGISICIPTDRFRLTNGISVM